MRLPLQDIRIMDFSRVVSGPYCTMILADMGAEVIKIEEPGHGDESRGWAPRLASGDSSDFMALNRNKKSITLNLKHPAGKEIVYQLAKISDIAIHNFRAGTMDRLQLGYEHLRKINPRLVYCSISGYGEDGPYSARPAYDLMIAGYTALQDMTGEPDGPPIAPGIPASDSYASLHAGMGILTALYHRAVTGEGQFVAVSMLDSQFAVECQHTGKYFTTGEVNRRQRIDNVRPAATPYGTFETATIYLNIGAAQSSQWPAFCRVIGRPDMIDDPRFNTVLQRVAHADTLLSIIKPILRSRPGEEWLELLEAAKVPCSPIWTLDRALADPQVEHNKMIQTVEHPICGELKVLGTPIKLSATPGGPRFAPPLLGQHNEEVLQGLLGYSADQVAQFQTEGAI